jgi:uncharacterized protein YbaR (Trm112 family)
MRGAMARTQPGVAILVCPVCRGRHVLRLNEPRARVECAALAEVTADNHRATARVWPAGAEGLGGHNAAIISITDL